MHLQEIGHWEYVSSALTCENSGIERSLRSLFVPDSVSLSVLYSQYCYSNEEHGQCGLVQVLVQEGLGKRLMVSNTFAAVIVNLFLIIFIANFKRGDRPLSTEGLRKVRTER